MAGRRGWVLVVEHDAEKRAALAAMLAELGYGAVPAASADHAFRLLRYVRPSAILLRLRLLATDGWEFRREQLRRGVACGVPAIAIAASRPAEADLRDLAIGGALVEPVRLEELRRVLAIGAPDLDASPIEDSATRA
jgi:DNA-binding response OmpR family regulator